MVVEVMELSLELFQRLSQELFLELLPVLSQELLLKLSLEL